MSTTLHFKVKASASKNTIEQTQEGWKLKIKVSPIEGKANKEIVRFLSKVLKVPKRDISIKSGQKSPYKAIMVTGLDNESCELLLMQESNQ